MNFDAENEMFRLAVELVNQSSRNIFLTGKAGTGKTTFLKYIRENCPKQMAVVAPTGVAAINAGGVTIHSFFQLPLSPFVPGKAHSGSDKETIDRHSLVGRLRMTTEKRKVLQQLELIIIDEISMVRCDTMDAIDTVLRFVRKRPYERFGGVQMLFIGDLFQLPPVIKEPEWKLLSDFYESPFFFDSAVVKEEPPVYIEFKKIYRQSEERFIRLLNQVRNNELDNEGLKLLEERYRPSFRRSDDDGYIILTSHNETARVTNSSELARLNSPLFTYRAEIEDDFPESAYPSEEVLQLKIGAQVMFIKNDSDKSKRYFNGKIGIITMVAQDEIRVRCKDDTEDIDVKKERWENIRYVLNKTSRELEAQILGSFVQYPLRLAWAITIHKSQGLTFEKAIIDAGEAFAPGQVYVALSRCTSLEGVVLKSKIRANSLFTDQKIVRFSEKDMLSQQIQDELSVARKLYQEKLLLTTFDFRIAVEATKELEDYIRENKPSFNLETGAWLNELGAKVNSIQHTADKFQRWLQAHFGESIMPGETSVIIERSAKAAAHFVKELDDIILELQKSPAVTDSKLHAKEYNDGLKEIFIELSAKSHLLLVFGGSFDVEAWHTRRKSFQLPPFTVNAYAGTGNQRADSPHPILHQRLRKLRDAICAPKDIPIYLVATSRTIDEMARYLPQTLPELRRISGFGDTRIEKYGQEFLDVIIEYANDRGLSSLIHEKSPKRERKPPTGAKKVKGDSREESFRLYQEGHTPGEIAKERNLTIQTIEGHLSYYVSLGEINIEELVSREKLLLIEPAIEEYTEGSVKPIKEKLGDDIGFGEIRLVLAWRQYLRTKEKPEG